MRTAVIVWTFVFILIGVLVAVWYLTEPICYAVAQASINASRSAGVNTSGFESGVQLIKTINVTWIGILIIVLVFYGILKATEKEGYGYAYGGM